MSERDPEDTGGKGRDGRYQPGQSGNPAGRPRGARSKLGEDFLAALYRDFAEHGAAVIAQVRQENPAAYLRIIAALMPKEVHVSEGGAFDDVTDAELRALIELATDALAQSLAKPGGHLQ